jgi:resuscitation-promoting factor RpfA
MLSDTSNDIKRHQGRRPMVTGTEQETTMPRRKDRTGSPRQAPAGKAGRVALLAVLAVTMAAAVAALALRALQVSATLPAPRVETYLELPVLAGGALAATWVGVSAVVALVCVAARSAGRTWARGERLVASHAPAVVRRAARIGVSVSVGAGLVLGGGTAHAAEPDVTDRGPAVAVVDLGWQPSATQGEEAATAAPGPAGALEADGQPDATPADEPSDVPTGPPPTDVATPDPDEPSTAPATAPAPTPEPDAAATSSAPAGPGTEAPASLPAVERDAVLTVTRDTPRSTDEVVVLRGDTLWAIAARALPADATDADVAAEVQRWHAANADVIGADPDLIRPGQVLVAPTT